MQFVTLIVRNKDVIIYYKKGGEKSFAFVVDKMIFKGRG